MRSGINNAEINWLRVKPERIWFYELYLGITAVKLVHWMQKNKDVVKEAYLKDKENNE